MLRNIKETIANKHKLMHYLLLCFVRYGPRLLKFNFYKMLRVSGIFSSKFEKIKMFKNKHLGQRCFIVATGPSLKLEDLEKIKGEITFSMNSIVLSFKDTTWRPTYYGIQDSRAFEALKEEILSAHMPFVFCGQSTKSLSPKLSGDPVISYPLNLLDHGGARLKHYTKFSDDAFSVVYDGFTITYSLLQIAVYLGFKEIYLMGVDCSYKEKEKNYLKEYIPPTDFSAGFLMERSYRIAKAYADKKGIKIYNASRGGSLEVFERVNLDQLAFLKGN